MTDKITLKMLKKWMRKTGVDSDKPETFQDTPLPMLDSRKSDPDYERFARMLVRAVIGNAIAKMEEPNAPASCLKVRAPVDVQIEMISPGIARASVNCCGFGCEECDQELQF